MASKILRCLLLFAVSLCGSVSPLLAQSHYVPTSDVTIIDNQPYCISGQHDCFTQLPGLVKQISTGIDGTIYATNSANGVFTLTPSTSTTPAFWSKSTLPSANVVALLDDQNVYALLPDPWCSVTKGTGAYGIFKANATLTAWVGLVPYACGDNVDVGVDGTIVLLQTFNGRSAVVALLPGATAWTTILASGMKTIADHDLTAAWGVGTDGLVYHVDLQLKTRTNVGGALTKLVVTKDTQVLWGVNSAGTVFSRDFPNNGGWVQYQSAPMSDIFVGASTQVFTLNAANVPFHYRNYGLSVTANLDGYWDCHSFQSGFCPSTATHVLTSSVSFAAGGLHGTAGVTSNSPSVWPSQVEHVGSVESSWDCDFLFGDTNSQFCRYVTHSRVFCSVMGSLINISSQVLVPQAKLAWTKSKYIVGTQHPTVNGVNCKVQPWCISSSPPICNPDNIDQKPTVLTGPATCQNYYYSSWLATKPVGGTWSCFPIIPLQNAAGTSFPAKGYCTGE
jgi:hypothetical protein